MKKTILVSAILFAFSSAVSAQELNSGEIQSALDAGTYEVNGQVGLTSTGTIFGNNLQTGESIQINFAENAKLSLESASNSVVSAQNGLINFALGESGNLEITSNSNSQTYTGMLIGNVNIKGGNQSQLSLITTGNDIPLADGHWGGLVDIEVDTLYISSGNDRAIARQNGKESTKIVARDITIEGRVQQGGGGSLEIRGFDTLNIDGKSKNALTMASGSMTISGSEVGKVFLTNNGESSLIEMYPDTTGEATINATEITLESKGEKSLGIEGGNGTLLINADKIDITAQTAVSMESANVSLNGTKELNITGDIIGTGGTLGIASEKTTVNGEINVAGETRLNGELVFNGNDATISNLTGDKATFTITKTDQDVSITNNNKALTLAATGDVNDEVGLDALKEIQLKGTKDGVQIIAHEGMYAQETTAVLDENGNMTNIVTKENSVMSNVLDLASATTLSLNRILMNDVRKRMGDLRSSEGTHGVWARYDGGSLSGSNGLENDFTTIQIGADTILGADVPRLGVAFAYTTSDGDMKRGDTEMDAYSLALYATKFYESGMFYDVIGRVAKADTDVTVDGYKKGSMDNLAVSLSGEFGWRFDVTDSFYVEPQTELTYTYIDSDKLTLSSGHEYKIDSLDSLVGRVGFAAGFKCPSNYGDVYVRASAVHEFLGDATVHGGDVIHEVDGEDTWVEFGLGANFNINRSTYVYADIERTEGAAIDEDWRANIGVRYSF